MLGRNKNIKTRFSDFLAYRKGELSEEERNLFERELQKDPFAEEAEEGFSTILPDDISEDLRQLQTSIHKRTHRNQRRIVYRIAASIAMLMIVSSVFIVVEKNKPSAKLSNINEPVIEIRRNQPLNKPEQPDETQEKPSERYSRKRVSSVQSPQVKSSVSDPTERSVISEVPEATDRFAISALPEATDRLARSEVMNKEYTGNIKNAAAATAVKRSAARLEGQVISTEDGMPVAGASIMVRGTDRGVVTDTDGQFSISVPADSIRLIASFIGMESTEFTAKTDTRVEIRMTPSVLSMDEIVVVGYGTVRKESLNNEDAADYIPPQPVNGKPDFELYIRENIKRPDTSTVGQRVVVVVRFLVKTDGTVSNIRIIRSPGKKFSDEAVRLIKSGPAWKPAEQEGIAKEDEIRVRIVFR